MKDETATQVNDVLGRECSEQELSQFEAYVDALGGGDIEEAIRLFDQFPAEDHEPLIEFMCRKLDAAAPPLLSSRQSRRSRVPILTRRASP